MTVRIAEQSSIHWLSLKVKIAGKWVPLVFLKNIAHSQTDLHLLRFCSVLLQKQVVELGSLLNAWCFWFKTWNQTKSHRIQHGTHVCLCIGNLRNNQGNKKHMRDSHIFLRLQFSSFCPCKKSTAYHAAIYVFSSHFWFETLSQKWSRNSDSNSIIFHASQEGNKTNTNLMFLTLPDFWEKPSGHIWDYIC